MTVPHTIHQIWIGPKQPPLEWMKPWSELDTWDYELWNDKRIRRLFVHHAPDLLPLYDAYLADERYCGAANVARVLILFHHGGVYIDADTILIRDFHDAPFMDYPGFVPHSANVEPKNGRPTRLQNGVLGFERYHPLLDAYLDALRGVALDDIHPSWKKTGGVLLTDLFKQDAHGTVMLPAHWFLPVNMRGKRIGPDVYARHLGGTTKGLYRD